MDEAVLQRVSGQVDVFAYKFCFTTNHSLQVGPVSGLLSS